MPAMVIHCVEYFWSTPAWGRFHVCPGLVVLFVHHYNEHGNDTVHEPFAIAHDRHVEGQA